MPLYSDRQKENDLLDMPRYINIKAGLNAAGSLKHWMFTEISPECSFLDMHRPAVPEHLLCTGSYATWELCVMTPLLPGTRYYCIRYSTGYFNHHRANRYSPCWRKSLRAETASHISLCHTLSQVINTPGSCLLYFSEAAVRLWPAGAI